MHVIAPFPRERRRGSPQNREPLHYQSALGASVACATAVRTTATLQAPGNAPCPAPSNRGGVAFLRLMNVLRLPHAPTATFLYAPIAAWWGTEPTFPPCRC